MSAPELTRYDGRPRLLAGWAVTNRPADLAGHAQANGPLPLPRCRSWSRC